ncbi:MAG: signal recognition particle subunit SRP19/SEC65 family protein [Promethearchaeota archaeon]
MRRRNMIRYWPQYFNRKLTRKQGRRLPKNLALDKVSLKLIVRAARDLGYDAEYQGTLDLKFPACWWEPPGCVMVDTKNKKKSKVLRQLAAKMREIGNVGD